MWAGQVNAASGRLRAGHSTVRRTWPSPPPPSAGRLRCAAIACTSTQVPHSDKAGSGVISGSHTDTVTVTCNYGYSGSGDVSCESSGSFSSLVCSGPCFHHASSAAARRASLAFLVLSDMASSLHTLLWHCSWHEHCAVDRLVLCSPRFSLHPIPATLNLRAPPQLSKTALPATRVDHADAVAHQATPTRPAAARCTAPLTLASMRTSPTAGRAAQVRQPADLSRPRLERGASRAAT